MSPGPAAVVTAPVTGAEPDPAEVAPDAAPVAVVPPVVVDETPLAPLRTSSSRATRVATSVSTAPSAAGFIR